MRLRQIVHSIGGGSPARGDLYVAWAHKHSHRVVIRRVTPPQNLAQENWDMSDVFTVNTPVVNGQPVEIQGALAFAVTPATMVAGKPILPALHIIWYDIKPAIDGCDAPQIIQNMSWWHSETVLPFPSSGPTFTHDKIATHPFRTCALDVANPHKTYFTKAKAAYAVDGTRHFFATSRAVDDQDPNTSAMYVYWADFVSNSGTPQPVWNEHLLEPSPDQQWRQTLALSAGPRGRRLAITWLSTDAATGLTSARGLIEPYSLSAPMQWTANSFPVSKNDDGSPLAFTFSDPDCSTWDYGYMAPLADGSFLASWSDARAAAIPQPCVLDPYGVCLPGTPLQLPPGCSRIWGAILD